MGIAGTSKSWHNQVRQNVKRLSQGSPFDFGFLFQYRDSAWIFAGGLPYDLTEGDVVCVFSQYGEIVHINLVRDQKTGKSKGFAFICYEDQRSTILAVDNLNGMKLLGRLVRVDHVETYKLPKDLEKMDADRKKLFLEGCAPKALDVKVDESESDELLEDPVPKKSKKSKKEKKKRKKKKRKKDSSSDSDSSESSSESEDDKKSAKKSDDRRRRPRTPSPSSRRRRSPSRSPDRRRRSRSREPAPRRDQYKRRSRSRTPPRRQRSRDRDRDRSRRDYRR